MSGSTVNKGLPYPLTSDFADVQDAFRLATAIDSGLRAEQAPLRAFMARPSFIGRQVAAGSGFTAGVSSLSTTAIDWDNTGGLTLGNFSWRQPLAMPPSWWLVGSTIFVTNTGAPVLGEGIMAELQFSTVDQVTGLTTISTFYQRNDESNTSGDWLNIFGMAPMYRGSVNVSMALNGTTTKAIGAGSRLWGIYLGPVT
jgi:hypothetical protein